VQLHDPVPMSMVRLFNKERAQMLVEAGSARYCNGLSVSGYGLSMMPRRVKGVRWQLEIDPLRI
jgi:primosomal protein N' (replication factor Y)